MPERLTLPTGRKLWEFKHGTVIFTVDANVKGVLCPKFYVQIIDQYRYQREWTIGLVRRPEEGSDMFYKSHIYRHPGRRCIKEFEDGNATLKMMQRFHYLVANYPDLLFNEETEDRPRYEGFVHLSETLLDGADPDEKLFG